jgi:chromosome segregation ATPase
MMSVLWKKNCNRRVPAHTKLVEKHETVELQLKEARLQEPTQCTDLQAEIDSLRVAVSQLEDQQPQECPEHAASEEGCSAVCATQLEKLRSNMQKQADGLRQRTFDAEMNADKERDRYNELEHMHNATLVTLQEQKHLLNATQAILEEERVRSQAHCPECPACEQVVAPTSERNDATVDVEVVVSPDGPTDEMPEEEHREPEVEPEPISETVDEAQAQS